MELWGKRRLLWVEGKQTDGLTSPGVKGSRERARKLCADITSARSQLRVSRPLRAAINTNNLGPGDKSGIHNCQLKKNEAGVPISTTIYRGFLLTWTGFPQSTAFSYPNVRPKGTSRRKTSKVKKNNRQAFRVTWKRRAIFSTPETVRVTPSPRDDA